MISSRYMLGEKDALLKQMAGNNNAFVSFLDTMAKFPQYGFLTQASLHRHAPAYTSYVATQGYWEDFAGTAVLPTAMPIPVLTESENGKVRTQYLYDIGDTVDYNNNDEKIMALSATYKPAQEQVVRKALGLDGEAELADALRTYVMKRVAASDSSYPDLLAAAGEYVLRQELGLDKETGVLDSISRDNVALEDFLQEVNSFVAPAASRIMEAVRAQSGQAEQAAESEVTENGRENDSENALRDVGDDAQGLPADGTATAVAEPAGTPSAPPVSPDVQSDDGETGRGAGENPDGEGRGNGSTETPEPDGVGDEVQQRPQSGAGADDGGNHGTLNPDEVFLEHIRAELRSLRRELWVSFDEAPDLEDVASISTRLEVLQDEFFKERDEKHEGSNLWGADVLDALVDFATVVKPEPETLARTWYKYYSAYGPLTDENGETDYYDKSYVDDMSSLTFEELYAELEQGVNTDYLLTPNGGADSYARRILLSGVAMATGHELTDVFTLDMQNAYKARTLEEFLALENASREQAIDVSERAFRLTLALRDMDTQAIAAALDHRLTNADLRQLADTHADFRVDRVAVENLLDELHYTQEAGLLLAGKYDELDALLAGRDLNAWAAPMSAQEATKETEAEPVQETAPAASMESVNIYYMKARPAGPGTCPDGGMVLAAGDLFNMTDADIDALLPHKDDFYDTIFYDRALTTQEMEEYELVDALVYESRFDTLTSFADLKRADGSVAAIRDDITFQDLYDGLARGEALTRVLTRTEGDTLTTDEAAQLALDTYLAYGRELSARFGHDEDAEQYGWAAKLFAGACGRDFIRFYKEHLAADKTETAEENTQVAEETAQTAEPAAEPAGKTEDAPALATAIEQEQLSLFPLVSEQAAEETGEPAVTEDTATDEALEAEADAILQSLGWNADGTKYYTSEGVAFPGIRVWAEIEVTAGEQGQEQGLFYGEAAYKWQFSDSPVRGASRTSMLGLDSKPQGFKTKDEAKADAVKRMLDHLRLLEGSEKLSLTARTELGMAIEAFESYRVSLEVPDLPLEVAETEDNVIDAEIVEPESTQTEEAGTSAPAAEIAEAEPAPARVRVSELPVDESFSGIDLDSLDLNATMATTAGARAVFRRNLAAVQIANHLEKTGHQANEKELAVLRSYAGFGGLAMAFDKNNRAWVNEYKLAKETFTDSEYASVRASTLTAFYTPAPLVKAIYEGLRETGFEGGNILDPSTGSGAFISNMPEDMKHKSNVVGVELDLLTARVAKFANPDAEIINEAYEKTRYKENSFDVAISNVPFGNFNVLDSRYPQNNYFIHDYFIRRMLDDVRPGGLAVVITSSGTMDKRDGSVRAELARKAELVRAVRLPNKAFKDSGTTAPMTDVLFFRKREKELGLDDELPDWVNSVRSADVADERDIKPALRGDLYINTLFNPRTEEHDNNVVGEVDRHLGKFGPELYVNDWTDSFDELMGSVHEKLTDGALKDIYEPADEPLPYPEQAPDAGKCPLFGYYLKGDEVVYVSPSGDETVPELNDKQKNAMRSAIRVRDKLRELMNAETAACTDELMEKLQGELTELYERHVKEYGRFNESALKQIKDDAAYPLLLSLECYNDEGDFIGLADIFTERTINAYQPPTHADSYEDALAISMREKGEIDLEYMAGLVDATVPEVVEKLEYNGMYEDGDGKFVPADEFLSGDIRQKIDDAYDKINHYEELMRGLAQEEAFSLPAHPEAVGEEMKIDYDEPPKGTEFAPENRGMLYAALNGLGYDVSTFFNNANYMAEARKFLAAPKNCVELMANLKRPGALYSVRYHDEDYPVFSKVYDLYTVSQNEPDLLKREAFMQMFVEKYSDVLNGDAYDYKNIYAAWEAFNANYEQTLKDYVAANAGDDEIRYAKERIAHYEKNIAALETVKPKDLTAAEIKVNLGATWVPTSDIEQFCVDVFKQRVTVEYSDASGAAGAWSIPDARKYGGTILTDDTYGTDYINAVALTEMVLNHRAISVKDEDNHELVKETILARRKADEIKKAFSEWIFKDPERTERIVSYYNRHFNNIVPRHFDGSNLTFPGMSPDIELKPHQKDAVARTLFGGNTLLAHVVGAGKTFEMQASCMEAKRLGLSHKAAMIMPGHLTAQFGREFRRLYPNAKILVANASDLSQSEENIDKRRTFLAKIASQEWDAVIMNYQQFESIPLSKERQMSYIQEEIDDYKKYLDSLSDSDKENNYSVKETEKRVKALQNQLLKMQEDLEKQQDDFGMTFENLGIDRLYVDESHNYKNLGFATKIQGIAHDAKAKTTDMLYKLHYLNDLTDEHGVVFASGTPISNSIAELYTLQRYLKPSRLKSQGLYQFDAWASTFGQEVTQMELKPEGDGYQLKTRFSKFNNLPELMSMFKEFADVQTADMLDLPTPEVENILEVAEASPKQKEILTKLAIRADHIRDGNPDYIGDPMLKDSNGRKGYDNMLVITGEGRKLAIDTRLVDKDNVDDYPDTKLNKLVKNVGDIYDETMGEKLTQVIFCDLGTPQKKKKGEEPKFCVYDAIREALMERGIPKRQIAYIHNYSNAEKKEQLFEKVRKGDVRILLGSSAKLGVGTNIQDRLIAAHDLDCPWRPSDIGQRRGRIERRGNQNNKVRIYRYVTNGTFDSFMWQTNERKQRFISQIMTSRSSQREADDVDELVLDYATAKAACTGNPLFKEQMELQNDLAVLEMEHDRFLQSKAYYKGKAEKETPAQIEHMQGMLELDKQAVARWDEGTEKKELIIGDKTYKDEKEMGKALGKLVENYEKSKESIRPMVSYHGMNFKFDRDTTGVNAAKAEWGLRESMTNMFIPLYKTTYEKNYERLKNFGQELTKLLDNHETSLAALKKNLESFKVEAAKPYPRQEELDTKKARLTEVTTLIERGKESMEEVEQEDRLLTIEGKKEFNGDKEDAPLAACFLAAAKAVWESHFDDEQEPAGWTADFDREVAKRLTLAGTASELITKALQKFSPTLPDAEAASAALTAQPVAAL